MKEGSNIFIQITKLEQYSDKIKPHLEDVFKKDAYYRAVKSPDEDEDGQFKYMIFPDETDLSFVVYGSNKENSSFCLDFREIDPNDMIKENLSEEDIDRLCDFLREDLDYELEEYKSEEDLMDKEFISNINRIFSHPVQKDSDKEDIIKIQDRARELSSRIDMDYVKFMLYEIKNSNPDMFLAIYGMINQTNRNL